jgi:lipopolysaccharide transport system permease protein
MILGLGWFLASVGTFVRDIGQILGTLVTALMFLSPIFFPLSALPDWLQPYLLLNPIALPVTQVRDVLIFGTSPDLAALGVYTIVATVVTVLGYQFFQKTRKGFADVL